MGGWGLGLFESDHDLDRVGEMDHDAGLPELENENKKQAKQQQSQASKKRDGSDANTTKSAGDNDTVAPKDNDDDYYRLSLYARQCANVNLVREHLESGALLKLINAKKANIDAASAKYVQAINEGKAKKDAVIEDYEVSWAVYELELLGACASMSNAARQTPEHPLSSIVLTILSHVVSLGCKLPDEFKALLIKKYRSTDLQRDALFQMQVALGEGPKKYKEGEPYDLESIRAEVDTADKNKSDLLFPGGKSFQMLNVAAPFGMLRKSDQPSLKEFSTEVYGGCGAKERGDGSPLLHRSKCKIRRYCGKVCQQAHFKRHKPICKEN